MGNNNTKVDRKSVALVRLNGSMIKKDGTEEPSDYFQFLQIDLDDYSDIAFSPEEAERVKKHMLALSTGSTTALPMICGGAAKCPFSDRCPYLKVDKERRIQQQTLEASIGLDEIKDRLEVIDEPLKPVTPLARQCLVEVELLNEWTSLYIREYSINPQNFTEFQMVRELAEIELLLWRLNNNLAKPENAELVQETTVGIDKQGNVLTRKEVSSIFDAKERLQNRKTKLIKLMVGDRQEKYKKEAALKQRQETDPSVSAARLRASIDRLINQAKALEVHSAKLDAVKIIDIEEEPAEPLQDSFPIYPSTDEDTLTPEDIISLSLEDRNK
jgi:hypothetical protein